MLVRANNIRFITHPQETSLCSVGPHGACWRHWAKVGNTRAPGVASMPTRGRREDGTVAGGRRRREEREPVHVLTDPAGRFSWAGAVGSTQLSGASRLNYTAGVKSRENVRCKVLWLVQRWGEWFGVA